MHVVAEKVAEGSKIRTPAITEAKNGPTLSMD